jgi:hypothetical protein
MRWGLPSRGGGDQRVDPARVSRRRCAAHAGLFRAQLRFQRLLA